MYSFRNTGGNQCRFTPFVQQLFALASLLLQMLAVLIIKRVTK
jgi:hypothetical protein